MSDEKPPFCWNTRVWLDFIWTGHGTPSSCPEQGGCIYEKCGYFEARPPTRYYTEKLRILRSFANPTRR